MENIVEKTFSGGDSSVWYCRSQLLACVVNLRGWTYTAKALENPPLFAVVRKK